MKNLSVAEISDTSKLIKEKMDIELKEIINAFELRADFFLTSNSLKKVWSNCFYPSAYSVPVDLFFQAFESTHGSELLTSSYNPKLDSKRRATLTKFFSAYSH